MTATAEPRPAEDAAPTSVALERAAGVELLGGVDGSGYEDGAALVRRADGQMVQLGPLMYAVLESVDGTRTLAEVTEAVSEHVGRRFDEEHVHRLAEKLAQQGLLAGSEANAPPRRNPLLALRWKVLVTNPRVTKWLTVPFTVLFSPIVMWPVLACFVGVFWFVLMRKGIASAASQAFHRPGLLLLIFGLSVASAAFHEIGHAAACRYGGATPGGMGMGIYLVWPAFYTDVTDSYRLDRRDRLRVDFGGLYFNAVVAVLTMGAWLAWRVDALLLLIALQFLMMVKNLSPVIRSDGYHILSDATGIPDLYAHIGPTLRRLVPWQRAEPSALKGRARLLVTLWVLIVIPVLLSLMLGAVLLLPRLATSAWDSGRAIAAGIPAAAEHGRVIEVLASLLRLLALSLPLVGSALLTQKLVLVAVRKASAWSDGRPARRLAVVAAASLAAAGAAWAWWPAGQYQPVRAADGGTLASFTQLISSPSSAARPVLQPAPPRLEPGRHLALALIPVGGATKQHPAFVFIPGRKGRPGVALLTAGTSSRPVAATAFPFTLPSAPGPGGNQALAVGTKDGGVVYDIAYMLVTVSGGAPVTNTNGAFAFASCRACTTVAVGFQVVLIVGRSATIAPINAAGSLNVNCPVCLTAAFANQIVVTLTSQPTPELVQKIEAALQKLDAISALGAAATPDAIAAQVAAVEQEIGAALADSGQLANPPASTTSTATTTTAATTTTSSTTTDSTTTTSSAATTSTPTTTERAATTTSASTTPTTTTDATTTTSPTTTDSTTTDAVTTTTG